MAEKKMDLRVQKTRRALAFAMLSLLERQSFSRITVNDICMEALVSRSAFYAHFADKYALLHFCMETLKERLFHQAGESLRARIMDVLGRIRDNVKIFRNLLMDDLDGELVALLRRSFHTDFQRRLEERPCPEPLPGPAEVISTFYAAGISSAILVWVERGMPWSDEEMADCLIALLPAPWEACGEECC